MEIEHSGGADKESEVMKHAPIKFVCVLSHPPYAPTQPAASSMHPVETPIAVQDLPPCSSI